jgi:hypothetical protein
VTAASSAGLAGPAFGGGCCRGLGPAGTSFTLTPGARVHHKWGELPTAARGVVARALGAGQRRAEIFTTSTACAPSWSALRHHRAKRSAERAKLTPTMRKASRLRGTRNSARVAPAPWPFGTFWFGPFPRRPAKAQQVLRVSDWPRPEPRRTPPWRKAPAACEL